MRQILTIAYHELQRMLQHRSILLMLFLMPLLIIFILGSALSSFFTDQTVRIGETRIAALVEDEGFIRDSLSRYLSGGQAGEVLVLEARTRPELEAMLQRGEADAGVVVPEGFSARLKQGLRPQWNFIQGDSVVKAVAALQSLQSFFDNWNLRFAVTDGWQGDAPPLETAPRVSTSSDFVKRTGWNGSNRSYTALQYYSAHMLVMFILYFGMSSGIAMVTTKEDGTLARLRTAPVPPWRILAGTVLGHGTIALLQVSLIVGGTAAVYGNDWGGSPVLLLLTVLLAILFAQSLAVLAGLVIKRKSYVTAGFQVLVLVSTFLAGGFSPTIGTTLAKLGTFTVNHWAADSLLRMMLREDTADILHRIRMLAIYSGAAACAALLAYRKEGFHE